VVAVPLCLFLHAAALHHHRKGNGHGQELQITLVRPLLPQHNAEGEEQQRRDQVTASLRQRADMIEDEEEGQDKRYVIILQGIGSNEQVQDEGGSGCPEQVVQRVGGDHQQRQACSGHERDNGVLQWWFNAQHIGREVV